MKREEKKMPLYARIAAEYEEKIQSGELREGDRLPSEAALAAETGAAVGTVKRAYAQLEEKGYIYKVRGGGSYVRSERALSAADADPEKLVENTVRELAGTGLKMNELFRIVRGVIREIYREERKLRVALVDCNEETLHEVKGGLEKEIPFLEAETYLLKELFSGETVIGSECRLALVPQKHYGEFIRYGDSINIRTETVALRESRETIARLALIPDWQEIRILYRSQEFLDSVRYTLRGLGKKNQLRCIREQQITGDDEAYYGGKTPFVIPADYKDYGNARMLQVIGHAEKIGSLIIPFRFEIDKGSLVNLKRVLDQMWAKEMEMKM